MLDDDDNMLIAILLAVAAGAGLWWYWQSRSVGALDSLDLSASSDTSSGLDISGLDGIANSIQDGIYNSTGYQVMSGGWINDLNTRGALYAPIIAAAEQANGIPPLLLARLAWQESRFRPDIIKGSTKSSAGAVGIMQIVPRWNPGVNPLDAGASINYAARKLAGLKKMLGTWELALKAYNWGEGNVQKWLAGNLSEPLETRNYSSQILADVNDTIGSTIA